MMTTTGPARARARKEQLHKEKYELSHPAACQLEDIPSRATRAPSATRSSISPNTHVCGMDGGVVI